MDLTDNHSPALSSLVNIRSVALNFFLWDFTVLAFLLFSQISRLDFFLLVVSQIFLKIKKLERNSKIIDRRLEREERDST